MGSAGKLALRRTGKVSAVELWMALEIAPNHSRPASCATEADSCGGSADSVPQKGQ